MKSLKLFLAAFLSLVLLAACNQSTSTNNASDGSGPKVDEILDKSITAMKDLKSYSMDMDLEQEMVVPGEKEPVKIAGKVKADMTLDPFALYQTMTLSSEMEGLAYDTETYVTEEGFFMSNPEDNSWLKLPSEFSEEMLAAQKNADEQLQLLKGFSEEITVTEEGNDYVLAVKGSGEKFIELTKDLLQQMGGEFANDTEMLSMMDMKTIDFIIHVNKDSFYQTKISLNMELEMTVEDETMSIKQKMGGTLSNFDSVEPIVIPEDVKNNAEEFAF